MKNFLLICLLFINILSISAQPDRWQQRVKYTMKVDMNVTTNQYTATTKLDYWNNSPDTLKRVFFHLYQNAFQPNSMMDVRSRRQGTIVIGKDTNGNDDLDWDGRVRDYILTMKPDEIGYEKVTSIKMNGRPQQTK
ncbi:MAG: M1 family peptidase, partial [Candidatus Dadabacteria bacterium]